MESRADSGWAESFVTHGLYHTQETPQVSPATGMDARIPTPSTLTHPGCSFLWFPDIHVTSRFFYAQQNYLFVIISFHKLIPLGDITWLAVLANKWISHRPWNRNCGVGLHLACTLSFTLLCEDVALQKPFSSRQTGEEVVHRGSSLLLLLFHWDEVFAVYHWSFSTNLLDIVCLPINNDSIRLVWPMKCLPFSSDFKNSFIWVYTLSFY